MDAITRRMEKIDMLCTDGFAATLAMGARPAAAASRPIVLNPASYCFSRTREEVVHLAVTGYGRRRPGNARKLHSRTQLLR
jgi:hypothetical protein